ncbi:MAG: PIN domain nuclease [Gammaproteobacteria bacterium]|jgi:predicted nucleic acid-binding protein|nr:PIN domain nuclease [Gammaproteobacteria bacterium]MBT7371644.1 PIN domain nuclease [Gammaproteobacteria bacterium]
MILIDTSAWIEFLRDTDSPVCNQVEAQLDQEIIVPDPVRMEILAGARNDIHLNQLRKLLARGIFVHTEATDFESAATLFRQCRAKGETVRKLMDCLIAAVAIKHNTAVLHMDADYDVLIRHTALQGFPL